MNKLKKYSIAGAVFVSIFGTLAHFCYQWSGSNPIIGLFTPVSESTWEHMKLLFFPALLFSPFIIHSLKAEYPGITTALFRGIAAGTLLIPVFFYTYTGILGFNLLPLDIGVFLAAVIVSYLLSYQYARVYPDKTVLLYKLLILALAAAFLVFTYYPPAIGLFADPLA